MHYASQPHLRKETHTLYYALMFLLLGVVAAALGLSGIAAIATQISWVSFVIGVVLLIVHMVMGRTSRVT